MRVHRCCYSSVKPARGRRRFTLEPLRRRRFTLEPMSFLILESLTWSIFLEFFFKLGHARKTNVLTAENIIALNYGAFLGKRCEKNYSSVRRYVADPVNALPQKRLNH
ncbi:hypothetical protein Tco_0320212 [Tanacetum coccineum]